MAMTKYETMLEELLNRVDPVGLAEPTPKARWFFKRTDGGPESHVTGWFLVEDKKRFTVAVMRFSEGSRSAHHTHAFNALSWLITGRLGECRVGIQERWFKPSLRPIWTPRTHCHKVISGGTSWVITFRGPWRPFWFDVVEFNRAAKINLLTHGRRAVEWRF